MRWEDVGRIADGLVSVLIVCLLVATIVFFIVMGALVWQAGGWIVGLLALTPVAVLVLVCINLLWQWYDEL